MLSSDSSSSSLIRTMTENFQQTTKPSRKRYLSEHNDDAFWKSEENDAIKKVKKELRENDSYENNNHLPPNILSFRSFENEVHSSSIFELRRSVSSIKATRLNLLTNSYSLPSETTMLEFEPNPSNIDVIHQKEDEDLRNDQQSIFITSGYLSACIKSNVDRENSRLFLIDCGSPFRYSERRIQESILLSINDKLSRKRLINRGFQQFLNEHQLQRFHQSETIILYDDLIRLTTGGCLDSNSQYKITPSMQCLYDQIKNLDTEKKIHILQSTFDEYYQQFPSDCYVNSHVLSQDNNNNIETPDIDINTISMSEILPGLFLGNMHDAENDQLLETNQIKSILNISTNIPCFHQDKNRYDYLQIKCEDTVNEDLLQHFDKISKYIHTKISNNDNVLVHCYAGISRSPTFVISYLMKYHSKSFTEACSMVKDKRKIINPNISFLSQLKQYERILTTNEH